MTLPGFATLATASAAVPNLARDSSWRAGYSAFARYDNTPQNAARVAPTALSADKGPRSKGARR